MDANTILIRKTVLVSQEALEAATKLAASVHVSQGSVIDTAIRLLVDMGPEEMVERMRDYGHLTESEYEHVQKLLPPKRRTNRRRAK